MKKKIKPENRIITKCSKCNKPYSYDKNKGWEFGTVCRECGEKLINDQLFKIAIKPKFKLNDIFKNS